MPQVQQPSLNAYGAQFQSQPGYGSGAPAPSAGGGAAQASVVGGGSGVPQYGFGSGQGGFATNQGEQQMIQCSARSL